VTLLGGEKDGTHGVLMELSTRARVKLVRMGSGMGLRSNLEV